MREFASLRDAVHAELKRNLLIRSRAFPDWNSKINPDYAVASATLLDIEQIANILFSGGFGHGAQYGAIPERPQRGRL